MENALRLELTENEKLNQLRAAGIPAHLAAGEQQSLQL
jgi:hypothetical protein